VIGICSSVIIAIGRVVDVVVREGEPLLFFRGAYR